MGVRRPFHALRRRLRLWRTCRRLSRRERPPPGRGWLLLLLLGLSLPLGLWGLERRMRPMAEQVVEFQLKNRMTALVEQCLGEALERRSQAQRRFITIERDSGGTVTALSSDVTEMNRLRSELVSALLASLSELSFTTVEVPLGSLLDYDLLWGRGPRLSIRALTAGSISAEFKSEFTAAGVNQTLHRVWLEVRIPLRLLLPGGTVDTSADSRLCLAETVIVGAVPDAYLTKTAP